jgi:SIR2-like domain
MNPSLKGDKIGGWQRAIPESLIACFRSPTPPIVFLGSGFGKEALPPLKTGGELADGLRALLKVSSYAPGLPELLQYLKNQEAESDRMVHDWLEAQLHCGPKSIAQPGGAHFLLLQLPIAEILTTNYDMLLADAAKRLGSLVFVETYSPSEYQEALTTCSDRKKVVCGMLHGSFANRSKLVATTDDYIDNYTRKEWVTLMTHFVTNRRIVFVGYSLRDFNSWTSHVTALMQAKRETWPHAMVSPPTSDHDHHFWPRYNIQFIPLKGREFLIGLHAALGTLEYEDNALSAAAACRELSLDETRHRLEEERVAYRYNLTQAALRCIQDQP